MIELQVFPPGPELRMAVRAEISRLALDSWILLETCDRVELYRGCGDISASVRRHLARVATGLESPLIGEKAVLGQVRLAMLNASAKGTAHQSLLRLFQDSIAIARRVRLSSGIDRGAIGHGQAVIKILASQGRPRIGEQVIIIGVNPLLRSILFWLTKNPTCTFILSNRNHAKAVELAKEFGAEAIHLDALSGSLDRAGIVISATAAPHYLVSHDLVRQGKPMKGGRLFFDLAVPPDIEPSVAGLPGCQLWRLPDIEQAMTAATEQRRAVIELADCEIERQLPRFERPYPAMYRQSDF